MEHQGHRDDDEQEQHTVGSLDTSMDRYLEQHGLWRKRIPQDGSSLFRAVSEDLFSTQVHHYDVRLKCIEHMELYASDYEPLVNIPLIKYLTYLKDPTTPGGMLEVEALARCYRVRIVVYSGKDHDPVECQYGSKKIMLSLIGYQFDRVITEERRRLLGIVQAYVYKFLYSEVFNQPKVVEQAKAMLRKSDTLYYGVQGASMQKNSDRSEKKKRDDPNNKNESLPVELIPVPYRTAKAFEPAIYRNVAYDVYMNDHFKKYSDRTNVKTHQHVPFMTHNRLVERFGVKMHLPVSYINPPDCRRVIITLSNSEELFAYYVGEDSDTNMHNVYLVKFGTMTKTAIEKMIDFPVSLGRRPVTFAQLNRDTNMYKKLKPCLNASLQFFEERSSRRQRHQQQQQQQQQQLGGGNNEQTVQLYRSYPSLMAKEHYVPGNNVCSPSSGGPWLPPGLRQQSMPMVMPISASDQLQLHHRLSVNVTDHYEWTSNQPNYFPSMLPPAPNFIPSSSNLDTMSLNGSTSSGSVGGEASSPYPLPPPMQTVYFNQFHQQRQQAMSPGEQQQQQYYQPPPMPAVFFPQTMSPRVPGEQQPPNLVDGMSNKYVGGQAPFVLLSPPPPPQQPVPGFHPMPMMSRVYMEPMRGNVCLAGQPFIPVHQQQPQQVSPPIPVFYSTSPPMTPWLAAPPPAYFMVPNTQPHTPFQQLI